MVLQLNFDKTQIMEFSGTKHNDTIIFSNIVKSHEFQGIKFKKHIYNWKAQLTWTI